ncbi:phosphoglycolate phosphatase [Palleronia aestuarii]|uniref:phosphoglycolate phosphatase n=1 Tax=Palleronia aestuarii TaxID=568105 RepID=A0A2W7NBW2_9RHOB|nr:HAD-IA family hydrolase [Palleronia aestuarii]PZX17648.1 phosphoglycolate phosphatase [Palleronia aestuarii]
MRTVIFDLDGTLVDTAADLIAAANACFRDMGHGDMLHPARDRATALRGGRPMLRLGLTRLGLKDETIVEAQYQPLLAHYGRAVAVHSALYPGAAEAIAELRAAGYAVGICTNKPEALAEALMTALGARDWFASLVGADTLPVRKPDPEHFFEAVRRAGGNPARALLVGDTRTDHDTARAAGVPSVLVSFGPETRKLRALAPDAFLGHYRELSGLAARLLA